MFIGNGTYIALDAIAMLYPVEKDEYSDKWEIPVQLKGCQDREYLGNYATEETAEQARKQVVCALQRLERAQGNTAYKELAERLVAGATIHGSNPDLVYVSRVTLDNLKKVVDNDFTC